MTRDTEPTPPGRSGQTSLRGVLVCPDHGQPLEHTSQHDPASGMPFPDGDMCCPEGCRFRVAGGIPRFIPTEDYAAPFGLQWRRYRRTQLDSYTGVPLSRVRLERCLGAPLESLGDKSVLEVGSGAGRFTELLIPHCGALVSMDMSSAVEANLLNCGEVGAYTLLQGDVRRPPLRKRSFDVVVCLGVIQHTPVPESTIAELASYVKPGGRLVIDHYAYRSQRFGALLSFFSLHWVLRAIAKRLPAEAGLRFTNAFTAISDPIRRATSRSPQLDRLAARVFCSACYYASIPELPPRICREWNELDTHDAMTDWYQHKRKPEELEACLAGLGFEDIHCEVGARWGNGIEIRGTRRAGSDD